MTKTRTAGVLTLSAPPHIKNVKFKNGTTSRQERDNGAAIQIPIGENSSITTSKGTDGRFRPCVHTSQKYHLLSNPGSLGAQYAYRTPAQIAAVTDTDSVEVALSGGWVPPLRTGLTWFSQVTALPAIPSVQWAAWSQEALQDMLPSFASGNDVLQFLIELKDFKSVAQGIIGKFNGRQKSLANIIAGINTGDRTLKQLSKLYLSYSFAWRPFVSDVIALSNAFSGFRRRWDEVVRRANTPQQRYWGRNIDGTELSYSDVKTGAPPQPAGLIPVAGTTPRYSCYRVDSKPARYTATIRYRYPLPSELTGSAGPLLALRDYLGTDVKITNVWDTIPFTFIIDWFVNVGSALDRLRVDNVKFKTEILDFCHSVKVENGGGLKISLPNGPGWVPSAGPWIPIVGCITKRYERRVGIPNFRAALATSGLSSNEFLLGGGLIFGRR